MAQAFVGEEAPTGVSAGGGVSGSVLGAVPYALLVALLVGAVALGAFATPFHYVDDLAVIAVAVVPALVCLAVFAARDGRITPAMLYGPTRRTTLKRLIALGIAAVYVPGNLILFANQYWDRSPGEDLVATVRSTWTRSSRGSIAHMAGIAVDRAGPILLASPLGRVSFYLDGEQPLRLPRRDWDRLVPERSAMVLRVHRGLFHFPWYERDPRVLP